MLRFAVLAIAITWAAMPAAAADDNVTPERLADIVVPEAASWTRFDALPSLGADELTRELGVALWDSVQRANSLAPRRATASPEEPACTLVDLFLSPDRAGKLHRATDADGKPMLIYSDSAACSEGDVTMIWRGPEHGQKLAQVQVGRILRVDPVPEHDALLFAEIGCCATPTDEFSIRNTHLSYRTQLIRYGALKDLEIPAAAVPVTGTVMLSAEAAFRSAPAVSDAYDESASQAYGAATFGNRLRRYLPGVEAVRLLHYVAPDGHGWTLLRTSYDDESRATETVVPVNVGWVAD